MTTVFTNIDAWSYQVWSEVLVSYKAEVGLTNQQGVFCYADLRNF